MKNVRLLIFMILALVALSSFKGDEKDKFYENKNGLIPADFDTRNSTLLIESETFDPTRDGIARYNERYRQYLSEVYLYKFEINTQYEIINNSKYADKDQYRYILADRYSTHSYSGGYSASQAGSYNVFYIYDRKLAKENPRAPKGSAFIMPTFKIAVNTITKFLKELK